ncbi:MAG: 3-deoxy-D-manno-octulosonic acid transferase [Planctomycetota bacterium]|jgi:3-deoxy-D-manno-octulosonic-acid transferase
MRFILDLLYLLAAAAYSPIIIYRVIRYKRYRIGWAQRFGKISRRNPAKKSIWLHAVSVGEINAARTIVKELEDKFGDLEIIISTTTDTGFARANTLFGENLRVFYFPLDFSWMMRRAFGNIRPAMCLLMELEVWPNFVQTAQQLSVPVIIVNGRISDKSFSGYKKIKPFAKKIFGKVSLILAQTDQYAQRFKEIGVPDEKVIVTGSLKYDTAQITDKVEGADALATQLNVGNERLWVAGATGPGEEKIVLEVYNYLTEPNQFDDLRLVIVPRKPERFDEVAQIITDAGFDFLRYSSIKDTDTKYPEKIPVVLGDTMGDLRKFYSLATIIFVGRTLVPMGGSDMAEAAALGKCTIFGPHAFNFKQTVDALLADTGAIMVKDEQELLQMMKKCLKEPDFAQKIAQNGREVIRKNQGATVKSIEQIGKFLTTT